MGLREATNCQGEGCGYPWKARSLKWNDFGGPSLKLLHTDQRSHQPFSDRFPVVEWLSGLTGYCTGLTCTHTASFNAIFKGNRKLSESPARRRAQNSHNTKGIPCPQFPAPHHQIGRTYQGKHKFLHFNSAVPSPLERVPSLEMKARAGIFFPLHRLEPLTHHL